MKRWQIMCVGLIVLSLVYWPAAAIILVTAGFIAPLYLLYIALRAMRRN